MDKSRLLALRTNLTSSQVAIKVNQITEIVAYSTKDNSKADKLAKDMMEVMSSEEFIVELDKKIGDVKDDETEDEFVMRGKAIIKNLLRKKFD